MVRDFENDFLGVGANIEFDLGNIKQQNGLFNATELLVWDSVSRMIIPGGSIIWVYDCVYSETKFYIFTKKKKSVVMARKILQRRQFLGLGLNHNGNPKSYILCKNQRFVILLPKRFRCGSRFWIKNKSVGTGKIIYQF